MSIRVVVRYLGLVLVMLGAIFLLPLAWSLGSRDGVAIAFLAPAALAAGAGYVLWRSVPSQDRDLTRREGLALVTCTWIAASLIGALPYVISGVLPSYVDALFEAMSGFTTTGATVIRFIGEQPPSVLLWRNYSQWIGGMGMITIFVALFPVLGIGAARLVDAETPGPHNEKLRSRTTNAARSLWMLYVGFSGLELLLLMAGGRLPFYDALNISFASMATGGFLHLQQSIGAYVDSRFVTTVVTVSMLAAGTNFSLYYYAIHRRESGMLSRSPEFRLYVGIFFVAALLITIDLVRANVMPVGAALQHATFQAASIQTTTGFTTADYDLWPPFSKGVLFTLMLVGGCAGSTAGGLKVVRLLVVTKYVARHIMTAFNPRIVACIKVGQQPLAESVVAAVVGTSCIYVLVIFLGFLLMCSQGLDGMSAMSAVVTTVGNVGPGLAAVGPSQSFAFISDSGKLVLTGLMLVGRLEFVTVLAVFHPMFWRWR